MKNIKCPSCGKEIEEIELGAINMVTYKKNIILSDIDDVEDLFDYYSMTTDDESDSNNQDCWLTCPFCEENIYNDLKDNLEDNEDDEEDEDEM